MVVDQHKKREMADMVAYMSISQHNPGPLYEGEWLCLTVHIQEGGPGFAFV
jgi:hypothetical protein